MSVESPQPLGPADVFSRGFGLWWRNAGSMAAVTLVVLIPMEALGLLVSMITDPEFLAGFEALPKLMEATQRAIENPDAPMTGLESLEGFGPTSGGAAALATFGQFVSILIAIIAGALVVGACLYLAMSEASGGSMGWRAALNAAMDQLRSIAVLQVIAGILLAALAVVTFFLLFIPAVWLAVAWCVVVPVLLFQGKRNFEALSESFRLVRHRWWPTSGALALAFLVMLPLILIPVIPFAGWLLFGWDVLTSILIATVLGVLVTAVTHPLGTSISASIYLDLRLRKHGLVPEAGDGGSVTWHEAAPAAAPPSPPSN